MIKKFFVLIFLLIFSAGNADVSVTTVDFLQQMDLNINSAGPLLVKMDTLRNRLVVANTLSSSFTVIDCRTNRVTNIPLAGRALQHLKSAAMTLNHKTGEVCLIGIDSFYIISPEKKTAHTVETNFQFETIAMDENTGNVFLAGRQCTSLGFYNAEKDEFKLVNWLDSAEELMNLNATPPPPIRKVTADPGLKRIIASDGLTARLFLFDATNGKLMEIRQLSLNKGGRWHFAGYNRNSHCLYLVIETNERKVIQAAKIDIAGASETIIDLPRFTEAVGINYHSKRDQVYIPYDNHPSVHVVDFKNEGAITEIKLPAFGNDASAVDVRNDRLFIASWAHGEIDVVNLKTRKLIKRIPNLGILPHMFNMAYNSHNNKLYIPKGATAVNGTFGAAVSLLDPETEQMTKIYTGWTPMDIVEMKTRNSFLVFNSEDQFAEVNANGELAFHDLPFDYPIQALAGANGDVYLSYGPHQSYWPNVYIWDAKNGMLTILADDLSFYDRRIPRQAQQMALDKNGVLYFTQNNWGGEEQFLGRLKDGVRLFEIGKRIRLKDHVVRETTQRILKYDAQRHQLYLVRTGEQSQDPSVFQVINIDSQAVQHRTELGLAATDLAFNEKNIYVSNFGSNTVSISGKNNFDQKTLKTGRGPLKLCNSDERIFVINHLENSLQEIRKNGKTWSLPAEGFPNNIFAWKNNLIITSHSENSLHIFQFDPKKEKFKALHEFDYPYGDVRFDRHNASSYMNGQFGDAVYSITRGKVDYNGRLWITDFLSGKLFILESE